MALPQEFRNNIAKRNEEAAIRNLRADPNLIFHWMDGDPSFLVAVRNGLTNLAEVMLSSGQDVNVRNGLGESALHILTRIEQDVCGGTLAAAERTIDLLRRHSAAVNLVNNHGQTALLQMAYRSTYFRDRGFVYRAYLDLGEDPKATDPVGWTALHHLCEDECIGEPLLVTILVEAGADAQAISLDGLTPLDVLLQRTDNGKHLHISSETFMEIKALLSQ